MWSTQTHLNNAHQFQVLKSDCIVSICVNIALLLVHCTVKDKVQSVKMAWWSDEHVVFICILLCSVLLNSGLCKVQSTKCTVGCALLVVHCKLCTGVAEGKWQSHTSSLPIVGDHRSNFSSARESSSFFSSSIIHPFHHRHTLNSSHRNNPGHFQCDHPHLDLWSHHHYKGLCTTTVHIIWCWNRKLICHTTLA